MKLVWKFTITNGVENWENTIPFEYSSKEDFCLKILSIIENKNWKNIKILKVPLWVFEDKIELENIERHVFTLEEWFEKYKEPI